MRDDSRLNICRQRNPNLSAEVSLEHVDFGHGLDEGQATADGLTSLLSVAESGLALILVTGLLLSVVDDANVDRIGCNDVTRIKITATNQCYSCLLILGLC